MKIVCKAKATDGGLLLEYPSISIRSKIVELVAGADKNYGGFLTVDIKKPYKSRSNEQNRMFWGIVQHIAIETGNDLDDIEEALKERALKRGYPATVNKLTGRLKPLSMTKVNTVEMGYLLDEVLQLCSELGINPDTSISDTEEDIRRYDIF